MAESTQDMIDGLRGHAGIVAGRAALKIAKSGFEATRTSQSATMFLDSIYGTPTEIADLDEAITFLATWRTTRIAEKAPMVFPVRPDGMSYEDWEPIVVAFLASINSTPN